MILGHVDAGSLGAYRIPWRGDWLEMQDRTVKAKPRIKAMLTSAMEYHFNKTLCVSGGMCEQPALFWDLVFLIRRVDNQCLELKNGTKK